MMLTMVANGVEQARRVALGIMTFPACSNRRTAPGSATEGLGRANADKILAKSWSEQRGIIT